MRASGREPWLLSGRRLDPVDADGRAVHLASPARAGLVLPAILLAALMAQLTAPPTDRPAQARPLSADMTVAANADALLRENQADSNFGADITLEVGKVNIGSTSSLRYAWVGFAPLSAIPPGSRVTAARLEVDLIAATGAGPLHRHRP